MKDSRGKVIAGIAPGRIVAIILLAIAALAFSTCTQGEKQSPNSSQTNPVSVRGDVNEETTPPPSGESRDAQPSLETIVNKGPVPFPDKPNILLLSLDTARADHVGCYGHTRNTTPNIDKFAKTSAVFERAYSHAPWTYGSFASLFTARAPERVGIFDWGDELDEKFTTLAEILKTAGYHTSMSVSMSGMNAGTGMDQGFDEIDNWIAKAKNYEEYTAISSKNVSDAGLKILDKVGKEPFFLWLHYYDPHEKYMNHDQFAFGPQGVYNYDEEIAFADFHIGRILDRIEKLGLLNNTIIIFHSDHGEEFDDHGGSMHSATLYEEVLWVPLIIYAPGITPHRIAQPVMLSDIAPTLLNMLGLQIPKEYEGLPIPYAGNKFTPVAGRTLYFENYCNAHCQRAVRRGDMKLIHDCQKLHDELFDLTNDPKERKPLSVDEDNEVFLKMRAALFSRRWTPPARKENTLSKSEKENLKSLGYVH